MGKGQVYSYSVNTNEIQIFSVMLGEIVGKVSFVEFGTVGALEVQQFLRPNTRVWSKFGSHGGVWQKFVPRVWP